MTAPTPSLPLGCGPEGSVSKYADLLNDLEDMAGSYAYAVRREVLRNAGRTIMQLERELAAAQEENAKLKAEITRVMQAAANGGYCRRNHAKCECENIAESIRIDE